MFASARWLPTTSWKRHGCHDRRSNRKRFGAPAKADPSRARKAIMIPAQFDYVVPRSLKGATDALAKYGDEAKLLAGGHSLLPMMKLRLAQPGVLIDLKRLAKLRRIRQSLANRFRS